MRIVTLCGCLGLAVGTWANQASDVDSVKSAVAALNDPAARASLFTLDANGRPQLEALLATPGGPYQLFPNTVMPVPDQNLTVIISHEPMGEAQIVMPPLAPYVNVLARPATKPPHITARGVRFVTSDVAVVDAVIDNPVQGFANFQTADAGVNKRAATAEVVLILVKQGGDWLVSVARLAKP